MARILLNLAYLALILVFAACAHSADGSSTTHHLFFEIHYMNVSRLCHTKSLVAVNGQFPGPTVTVREGDRVIVQVRNRISTNLTIHWHGVRQMYSCWSDGPVYVAQCPIQPNNSFTHNFKVVREMGTLFWHAHLSWLRATVHGAFLILPRLGTPYPFPKIPHAEFPIILGEWWNADVLDVERYGLADGGGYNLSNALTINGQPGFLYNCSTEDAIVIHVKRKKTYLLRLINAAMNFQLYFQIANHNLTVVQTDASLSKPYTSNVIMLAPGQTADVLFTANQAVGHYYMAASAFSPAPAAFVPYPTVQATALLSYKGAKRKSNIASSLPLPTFPAANDSNFALSYLKSLRSLDSEEYPAHVPQELNHSFLFTAGYAVEDCPSGQVCHGPSGSKVSTSISNITFRYPQISILQAYYESTHDPVDGLELAESTYQGDFPNDPLFAYNYTGLDLPDKHAVMGTRVKVLEFASNVQLVLQNTRNLFFESHPFHLHGYNFYVVGAGFGNFNSDTDPSTFNLVDAPAFNTIAIPAGGWVALRFYTDNPGAWLMHCHFEMHTSWGMAMVWIVKDGKSKEEKLPPPPQDYPQC